jgi:hypothetical protein
MDLSEAKCEACKNVFYTEFIEELAGSRLVEPEFCPFCGIRFTTKGGFPRTENPPAPTNWKPISSAPKDGTPILGRCGYDKPYSTEYAVVQWHRPMCSWHAGWWRLVECGACAEDDEWEPEEWIEIPQ